MSSHDDAYDWVRDEATTLATLEDKNQQAADDYDVDPAACRVCGCTDDDACWPPCSWADDTLCTACVEVP